jgi:hypothetical protein
VVYLLPACAACIGWVSRTDLMNEDKVWLAGVWLACPGLELNQNDVHYMQMRIIIN